MRLLIKNAKIICSGSTYNGKKVDILIHKGIITSIAKSITDDKATLITGKELYVSIGWMDIGTHMGEPGHEHRETMKSLCTAALAGGFTDIAPFPNAEPTIQTKSQILSIKSDAAQHGVTLHPIGSLSVDTKGENISEYIDMHKAGAVAFSDGLNAVQKNGLLLRALQYAKGIDSIIINHPTDHSLDNDNQVHEGLSSIRMGIKGSPEMAEHIMVDRDLQLAKYTESRLCMHALSSKGSIDRLKKAKSKNPNIKASVAYLNLVSSDEDMLDFDSNYKVLPVLRSKVDQNALLKATKDGLLDYICSNHVPLEPEAKELEFSYASNGATGLETMYAAINTLGAKSVSPDNFISLITKGPRATLGLQTPIIKEGEIACLTCWDPTIEWVYDGTNKKSKSANNPFMDTTLSGKVVATINGKSSYIAS